jgi:hypothetical protein
MELGAECLLAWLDPDRQDFPTGGYEVAHDTGRWWDAMLRLEATLGLLLPADREAAMLRNLQRLLDNPDGLLMNLPDEPLMGDRRQLINPHNFREGMLALGTVARVRGSQWAVEAGLRMLRTLDVLLQPDGRLDYTRLQCWGKVAHTEDPCHRQPEGAAWFDATANSGRALEAIVWFYEATGEPLALDVASRIAEHHLRNTVHADGSPRAEILDPDNVGHNHSYLGTLRGLLLYGLLSGQRAYVDAVSNTYRKALWQHHITESGVTPHDLGKTRFPNETGDPVPEAASCGDVAQIALWLAVRDGQTELLDDVERLVRARLLPEQIVPEDGEGLGPKQVGGWGVHGPLYGKGCILDVAAAVVHTLCDIHASITTLTPLGLMVNLHLTAETPHAGLVSERAQEGQLTVRPFIHANTCIRLPGWVPQESVRVAVNGEAQPARGIGPWLFLGRDLVAPGCEITLRHALPERESTETFGSGASYRLRWRGDTVLGIDPHDGPFTIHPPLCRPAGSE